MKTATFIVTGMCCAAEQSVIESKLQSLRFISRFSFNLVAQKLTVEFKGEEKNIIDELKSIGFIARVQHTEDTRTWWEKNDSIVYTSISLLFLGAGFFAGAFLPRLSTPLFFLSIIIGGWKVFQKAIRSARQFSLEMNVLMALATIGAIALGEIKEAAVVMVLFSFALMLEQMSLARTRKAIQSLMHVTPTTANVNNKGIESILPVEQVEIGDAIIIRPGEIIPLDGIVEKGVSFVNQSAITGESTPLEKTVNDIVFAGTVNERGTLEARVTQPYTNTVLAKILHRVEEAQNGKAKTQEFVERFARVYTPVVVVSALVVAILPAVLFSVPFSQSLYRALVLLVAACPCALVISTPVAIVSALTNAARSGVLLKGGKHLETLASLKALAIDKTGTLTEGKMRLTRVVQLNSISSDEVLRIASLLESRSEHHIADAIHKKINEEQIDVTNHTLEEFAAIPGKGISGRVNGASYYLGNHRFMEETGICSPALEKRLQEQEPEGETVVILGNNVEPLGILTFSDTHRQESAEAIKALRSQGIEKIVMLTGDNDYAAKRLAKTLALDEYAAGLLPEDKIAYINSLKATYGTVGMLGDGVNDAPALATANIGIAMGTSGTDIAIDTADVVLMSDDIRKLPYVIDLSKRMKKIILQNIAFALSTKAIIVVLGIFGSATLWMAILADDGAALLVVVNALRLLKRK